MFLSVSLSVTRLRWADTANLIEIVLGGPRNIVLNGSPDPHDESVVYCLQIELHLFVNIALHFHYTEA